MKKILSTLLILSVAFSLKAENGYNLWLRYDLIRNKQLLNTYRISIASINLSGTSATMDIAKDELIKGLEGLLGRKVVSGGPVNNNSLLAGTPTSSKVIASLGLKQQLQEASDEGFVITTNKSNGRNIIVIAANNDIGVLYGVFHFLRLLQTEQSISSINIVSAPKIRSRVLNHWDNLDRYVERGYAGISLWNWHTLPGYIDQRYIDYARANASIGINGTVLTNVNANALVLTKEYLVKVAALAKIFRPYGIKVYLTARFSAPIEIGKLKTADPLDPHGRFINKVRSLSQVFLRYLKLHH